MLLKSKMLISSGPESKQWTADEKKAKWRRRKRSRGGGPKSERNTSYCGIAIALRPDGWLCELCDKRRKEVWCYQAECGRMREGWGAVVGWLVGLGWTELS